MGIEKILGAIVIGVCMGTVGYILYSGIKEQKRIDSKKEVIAILDENKDGLSGNEIKRFYDKMGLSPYTLEGFDGLPREDFEGFLSNYELKQVRKNE